MTPAAPARGPGARQVLGWDVGGAHVKACLLRDGRVADVAQWACPLWQGLQHLDAALAEARQRWPQALHAPQAVTMTGEMTDLFSDREDGVQRITDALQAALPGPVRVYAGPDADGRGSTWAEPWQAAAWWPRIASANWLATAQHAAARWGSGLLVDIGSTTTDLVAFEDGRVLTTSRSDRDRLARGELAYHGVVRTPLCALAERIPLQGQDLNVMNELFATVADVYRLTGELDPAHDLYPAADQGSKSLPATRQRLARMVGCDLRDANDDEWLAFAHAWRQAQVAQLARALKLAWNGRAWPEAGCVVSAGCGDFLVPDLLRAAFADAPMAEARVQAYGEAVVAVEPQSDEAAVRRWAQVCAPSVAVAALLDRELA